MSEAAKRAGRGKDSVRLIAVSKTKPVSDMRAAYAEGVRDFGENYVQEVLLKAPELPADARLHFIGHLQTNKAGKIVDKVCMIHSVDSLRLCAELEKQAEKKGVLALPILFEVNIANEASKFGFAAEEVLPAVRELARNYAHLKLRGFMTSAPVTEHPEENRKYFAAMKKLLSEANEMIAADADGSFQRAGTEPLTELSMGMTGDFEPAIEEGATFVRIGTAIFGAREYSR